MWRRLLRRCHPDHGGEADLFVWVQALHDHVAGNDYEEASTYARRSPPQHPSGATAGERIDFAEAYDLTSDFGELTARALAAAELVGEPYARLIALLGSCYPLGEDARSYRAQYQGATYKQLAFAAHLAGFDQAQRIEWYRIAERIPLSQRHASHIVDALIARGDLGAA